MKYTWESGSTDAGPGPGRAWIVDPGRVRRPPLMAWTWTGDRAGAWAVRLGPSVPGGLAAPVPAHGRAPDGSAVTWPHPPRLGAVPGPRSRTAGPDRHPSAVKRRETRRQAVRRSWPGKRTPRALGPFLGPFPGVPGVPSAVLGPSVLALDPEPGRKPPETGRRRARTPDPVNHAPGPVPRVLGPFLAVPGAGPGVRPSAGAVSARIGTAVPRSWIGPRLAPVPVRPSAVTWPRSVPDLDRTRARIETGPHLETAPRRGRTLHPWEIHP